MLVTSVASAFLIIVPYIVVWSVHSGDCRSGDAHADDARHCGRRSVRLGSCDGMSRRDQVAQILCVLGVGGATLACLVWVIGVSPFVALLGAGLAVGLSTPWLPPRR